MRGVPLRELDVSDTLVNPLPAWLGSVKTLKSLNLWGIGLTGLPQFLSSLDLEEFELMDNKIVKLPDWMAKMKNLRHLGLSNCGLLTLPAWLGDLTKLEYLSLSNNYELRELPPTMARLTLLSQLWLNYTKITAPAGKNYLDHQSVQRAIGSLDGETLENRREADYASTQVKAGALCSRCNKNPANPGRRWCQACFSGPQTLNSCVKCTKNPANPGFDLCQRCYLDQVHVPAFAGPTIKHPWHPHLLRANKLDNGWRCDGEHQPGGCRRGLSGSLAAHQRLR